MAGADFKVYRTGCENGADWLQFDRESDDTKLWEAGTSSVVRGWAPAPVSLFREVGTKLVELTGSRMPCLSGGTIVLRDEAIETIGPLLGRFAELLPLSCPQANLMLVHVTNVLDVLDKEASEIARLPEEIGGGIIEVANHIFKPDMIPEYCMFKIPEEPHGEILLTESLASRISEFGYHGTIFQQVA